MCRPLSAKVSIPSLKIDDQFPFYRCFVLLGTSVLCRAMHAECRQQYFATCSVLTALPPAARAALQSAMEQHSWQHAGRTAIAIPPWRDKNEVPMLPCIAWSTFSIPTCRDSIKRHPAVPRERDGRGESRFAHKYAQMYQDNAERTEQHSDSVECCG